MSDLKKIFVIMPFAESSAWVYEHVIKSFASEKLYISRADEAVHQRNVVADIITGISDADLIIADVTGLNPNVMYELGIAHALGKHTLILTDNIIGLPFDFRSYRATLYENSGKGAFELRGKLGQFFDEWQSGKVKFSSPVIDYMGGIVLGDDEPEVIITESDEQDGLLENFQGLFQIFEEIVPFLDKQASMLIELADESTFATNEVSDATSGDVIKARLVAAAHIGSIFEKNSHTAKSVNDLLEDMLKRVVSIEEFSIENGDLGVSPIDKDSEEQIQSLVDTLTTVAQSIEEMICGAERLKGLSKSLRGPVKRFVEVHKNQVEAMRSISSSFTKMLAHSNKYVA